MALFQTSNNIVEANTITRSAFHGLTVRQSSTGNRFTQNSIVGNSTAGPSLGINLIPTVVDDGVSPNDVGDGDTGPNNLQNFPVLARASTSGATTTVVGTLDSAPGTYAVELFDNAACHVSGHGEGG